MKGIVTWYGNHNKTPVTSPCFKCLLHETGFECPLNTLFVLVSFVQHTEVEMIIRGTEVLRSFLFNILPQILTGVGRAL